MFAYRQILGTRSLQRVKRTAFSPYVHGLYDTTYHNRRRAFDITDATSLESSVEQVTKGHVNWDICIGDSVSSLLKFLILECKPSLFTDKEN